MLVGGLEHFFFPIYWEEYSQLTNSYFQRGWNQWVMNHFLGCTSPRTHHIFIFSLCTWWDYATVGFQDIRTNGNPQDHVIFLWFSISIISIEIAWLFLHVFSRSSCILLLWHNYHLVNIQKTMENHNFQCVNPRIQWPFSSSQTVTNYQRVKHYYIPSVHMGCHPSMSFPFSDFSRWLLHHQPDLYRWSDLPTNHH